MSRRAVPIAPPFASAFFVLAVLAGLSWPAVAHAQGEEGEGAGTTDAGAASEGADDAGTGAESQAEALATELFNHGKQLMEEGRYPEACPKLAESAKLDPKVGTLGKLASCEEQQGRLVSARAHWQQAVNTARSSGDDRLELSERELARIDALVPKLRLSVPADAPSDLQIRVDKLQVGLTSVGVPIPVDPGAHTITVWSAGAVSWEKTVTLSANGAVTPVDIPPFTKSAPVVAPPPVAPAPAAPPSSGPGVMTVMGVIAAGVGGVSLATGAYFGGVAQSKLDDSNDLGCDGASCPPDAAERRDEAVSAGNLSTVFFLAGGALVVGGITLWLLDPGPDGPSVGATVSPTVSSRTGAPGTNLSLSGTF